MTDCRSCKARPRADHVFRGAKREGPQGPARDQRRHRRQGAQVSEVRVDRPHRWARPFNLMSRPPSAPSTPATTRDWPICAPRPRRGCRHFNNVLDTHAPQAAVRPSRRSARRSGTRSRPATSPSARASSSRWRSQYFSSPRRGRGRPPGMDRRPHPWYPTRLGLRARTSSSASRARTSWPLRQALRRPRVPLPMGWSELEGIANRIRLRFCRPHSRGPNTRRRRELRTSIRSRRSPSSPTHRAVGGRRTGDAGVPSATPTMSRWSKSRRDDPTSRAGAEVESFVRVGREAGRQADGGRRQFEAPGRGRAGDRRRAAGDRCPRLLGPLRRRRRQPVEVFKKVRGLGREAGRRVHPHRAAAPPAPVPDQVWRSSRWKKKRRPRLVEEWRADQARELQAEGVPGRLHDTTGAIGKL